MKTTEIIERLLALPEAETLLSKLEDRIAEDSATPDAAGILTAYVKGDVDALFAAFTGRGMKEFLAITCITPDTTNLLGIPKDYALFQDITSVETPGNPLQSPNLPEQNTGDQMTPGMEDLAHATTEEYDNQIDIRVFLSEDSVGTVFVKGGATVNMETVQMYISKYEINEPENAGRLEKIEDYFDATRTDPAWKQITPNENNCSEWKLRKPMTFNIRKHPGGAWGESMGEFCLMDLDKLTIGVWNDGNPEPAFSLATVMDDFAVPAGCVVIRPAFDTGLGFTSDDAVRSLADNSILSAHVQKILMANNLPCQVRRINPVAASNYLVESEAFPGIAELARRLDQFAEDFDPYDYADTIDNKDAHIKMLIREMGTENPTLVREILKGVSLMVAQTDDDRLKKEGQYLIDKLNALIHFKLKDSGVLRRLDEVLSSVSDEAASATEEKHDIPNEMSAKFNTVEGRQKLVETYGAKNTSYTGVNEDGENIIVSFDTKTGIVLRTNQHNGWTRLNYYDVDGYDAGETFDGRWKNSGGKKED